MLSSLQAGPAGYKTFPCRAFEGLLLLALAGWMRAFALSYFQVLSIAFPGRKRAVPSFNFNAQILRDNQVACATFPLLCFLPHYMGKT